MLDPLPQVIGAGATVVVFNQVVPAGERWTVSRLTLNRDPVTAGMEVVHREFVTVSGGIRRQVGAEHSSWGFHVCEIPVILDVGDRLETEIINPGGVPVTVTPVLTYLREIVGRAMTWVSAKTAAPTANSVQADTGTLTAGEYDFDVNLAAADTLAVGKGLVVEHRNVANGATLFNLGGCAAGESRTIQIRRYVIVLNERIRVIAGTAAGAASSMYVSAIGRRLA